VGSLLRPESLLDYKMRIEQRDDIAYPFYNDFDGYKREEDQAVEAVVGQQIEHGLPEVTDGEYSKSMCHLDFVCGLNGIKRYIADNGYFFSDLDQEINYETRKYIGIIIDRSLCCHNHTFIDNFNRLKEVSP